MESTMEIPQKTKKLNYHMINNPISGRMSKIIERMTQRDSTFIVALFIIAKMQKPLINIHYKL